MGSGANMEPTQTQVKCNCCGEHIRNDCAWQQGRCPHAHRSTVDLSQFYNFFKFLIGRK